MNEIITEKIDFPEKMPADAELFSEKIIDTLEKIGTDSEQNHEE